jgi:two-component system response regulator AtoC
MFHILLIDDEIVFLRILKKELELKGYEVVAESDSSRAMDHFCRLQFDMVILDINMPHKSGYDILQEIRRRDQRCNIILVTAYASIEGAVQGMKLGANDYLQKPFALKILMDKIAQLAKSSEHLPPRQGSAAAADAITRLSPSNNRLMALVAHTIDRVKDTGATVLITGENGSGKGVAAKMIHYSSNRAKEPFMLVDCAAMPENLMESELFGYEKGAFTGAVSRQKGKFEQAGAGTIFLDEIGVLPHHLQTRLLTVLQERYFFRVGGTERIPVRARIVAATNENLEESVKNGIFREDLYYRLNVVRIEIPPLRLRREDIPPLSQDILRRRAQALGVPLPEVEPAFFDTLCGYHWPGNLRELENALESALILCDGRYLKPSDLPLRIYGNASSRGEEAALMQRATERSEISAITAALEQCGGNRESTAKLLGISRRTLQYKLKKYGLLTPRVLGSSFRQS